MKNFSFSPLGVALAATLLATSVPAAAAAESASTRLHRCGEAVCLMVRGWRSDPAEPVLIEGRQVTVDGGRHWRASLPLATVERWVRPFARSILIETGGAEARSHKAALPIGVLGQTTDLAFLSVGTRR